MFSNVQIIGEQLPEGKHQSAGDKQVDQKQQQSGGKGFADRACAREFLASESH